MSDTKYINWGIMGCGTIAHKFAEDLCKIPTALVYAVASRDLKKANDFGRLYNAYSCYGSYEELVKNTEVDVIYIATPHVFHYENTLLCLDHKKAVLCEKPFAMTIKQVREMIRIAQKNQVFLMEALWTYFLPHYTYVLEIIASKKLGNVLHLKADFGFVSNSSPEERLFNKKLGGGSLLDVGIYPLFAALTILGYPDQIQAKAYFGDTGVDENCSVELSYKNGRKASLYSSITKKTKTEAIITLDQGKIIVHSRFHEPSSVTIIKNETSELLQFPVDTHGYSFEAVHVQQMLTLHRTESTVMTFEKSLQLIALLDTIREKIGLYYE
ncbi:Gfo/Idh/MocA family oxidoreductase [Aquimarina addita]|uniref:Gfo/Idh/MocA family oxidoreductase n=1 Tax=Aquimarina addita TaxID=870485 RepID=A0ABP7XFN4_9FLAO